jgi:Family of unknown function (DUF5681)
VTESSDEYPVGRGRPPRRSRWKKGQSGNKRRREARKSESVSEMIDRLLLDPVQITLNGEKETVLTLTAIMFQLFQKAFAGNTRAKRVLLKYQEFARNSSDRRLRVTFVENDYTLALAKRPGGSNG